MLKFVKSKVIGSDWVTVLQPTKKEAKVLKDKAVPVGAIYYIDEDLERTTAYYQVGSNPIAVYIQGMPRYKVEEIMNLYPGAWVHGYIKSNSIFPDEEVLIRTELINYGLYTLEEDTEEDTSEDCVDDLEEDTSEDCVDDLEEDTSEDEEDTSEDCGFGSEEDTSIKGEVNMKFINGKLDMNDCGDGLELCPHKEEDTSEDYIETTNVCGVEIKNHCISFGETMLVHEAVEKELIGFFGDLNLGRRALVNADINYVSHLDKDYNNMLTGFIVFGAALKIFTSDVKYSKDCYLGYIARSYNLSELEIKELARLIDLGISFDNSVIKSDIYTLHYCLKSFVGAVSSYIRFKSQCYLDYEQVLEKLQIAAWFDRAAKFYLTMVCWGRFKPASCIDDDDNNIDYYDYPLATWYYNVNLGLFEGHDMTEIIIVVADTFNIQDELLEKYYDDDAEKYFDGTVDIDTAIYILDTWRNQQNKNFKVFPYNEQIKLRVLRHVIRKLKGVH